MTEDQVENDEKDQTKTKSKELRMKLRMISVCYTFETFKLLFYKYIT